MVKENYLNIKGSQRSYQNLYWTTNDYSSNIAVFFPGYRYPTEAPLFHYLKMALLQNNWSLISVEYRFNEDDFFLGLDDEMQDQYIEDESTRIGEQLKPFLNSFDNVSFFGKSLGTTEQYKILQCIEQSLASKIHSTIWLTPAESNAEICTYLKEKKYKSLYAIGDMDSYSDPTLIDQLNQNNLTQIRIIQGAGHLFEDKLSLDISKSIENMKTVVMAVASFFGFPSLS